MKKVCDVHIYRLFFVTLNEIGGKSTWEKLAISCTHSASLISVNSNFWREFRTKINNISQYLAKNIFTLAFSRSLWFIFLILTLWLAIVMILQMPMLNEETNKNHISYPGRSQLSRNFKSKYSLIE